MASAPCRCGSNSFDLRGSGVVHYDFSPQSGSGSLTCESSPGIFSSASFLADRPAPVYPFDEDEAILELSSVPSNSSSSPLLCSAQLSERHVFLCFKEPRSWPSVVEGAESDRLPRFLSAAIKCRKNEMLKKTRLIVCEGRDGTDSSNGDVMLFPDMVRYRGLTHFDVDAFVEEVLVRNQGWAPGRPERLHGTFAFVCAHGNHEINHGKLGPALITKLKEELACHLPDAKFSVKPCSYIGGHKFVKNLIVYGSNCTGQVLGHWYGSVTLDNISNVLHDLALKGYFTEVEDSPSDVGNEEASPSISRECSNCSCSSLDVSHHLEQIDGHFNVKSDSSSGLQRQKLPLKVADSRHQKRRTYSSSKWWQASWWFCFWEEDDTLATLAVMGAAASVALAYYLHRSYRD
ncbi:hypothetical protein KP509_01G112800 [Ceratopteris richardii]|uniref:Sucrase/ferredoxin-like family protein n=1 Tax=Ceratopteris richardii TaxID=49495 RepID=A0A8T2VGF3_CERRI|nr:hypothetical protein KP509_01G112800 [Ceratopteris richardii]